MVSTSSSTIYSSAVFSVVLLACVAAASTRGPLTRKFLRDAGAFADDFVGMDFDNSDPVRVPMKLQLLTNQSPSSPTGAVCLDGSPGAFYFSPATASENSTKWQLYFQGGGWCYDENDCLQRSKGNLGSSKRLPPTSSLGGLLSDDCSVNPDFCSWNRVHMSYCDGNSFSGARDTPVVVNGTDLYFRGHHILDATIAQLLPQGLSEATEVLVTGCSAGGLASYLHADYVSDQLKASAPKVTKIKTAPISGFFINTNTVEGKPVYPLEMKTIFELSNATIGLNPNCIAAQSLESQWLCNFAEVSYQYTHSPIFPLQSALDAWQTKCIFTSEFPAGYPNQNGTENGVCGVAAGWGECSSDPEKCTSDQMTTMNGYLSLLQAKMASTATFGKAGNGAFLYSCHNHCGPQSSAFDSYHINGVSMQQAIGSWWASDSEPASSHTSLPCQYKTTSPHKCNPTC